MDINIGQHCSVTSCRQLDFLPFTCDACKKIFCADHRTYADHSCTESYSKDRTVPVCPVCASPVPVKRGEDPNHKMNLHIEQGCKDAPQTEKAVFVNQCGKKGCKKREAVPLRCASCNRNHCFAHRLEVNHDCPGKNGAIRDAAEKRRTVQQTQKPSQPTATRKTERPLPNTSHSHGHHNGGMNEDEALAYALAQSQQEAIDKQQQNLNNTGSKCSLS